jgi:hypothetical protein
VTGLTVWPRKIGMFVRRSDVGKAVEQNFYSEVFTLIIFKFV